MGDHRANMSVGVRTEVRALTEAEQRVCDEVGPMLRDMGLLFVGIDVIGGYLTEINVTSLRRPGFARSAQKLPADRSVGVDVACSRVSRNSNEGRWASRRMADRSTAHMCRFGRFQVWLRSVGVPFPV
jgi:hypothetical protein